MIQNLIQSATRLTTTLSVISNYFSNPETPSLQATTPTPCTLVTSDSSSVEIIYLPAT